MRKVKSLIELLRKSDNEPKKGIEFTLYYANGRGVKTSMKPQDFDIVVYVGSSEINKEDYFMAYYKNSGEAHIYSGKLNDGTY